MKSHSKLFIYQIPLPDHINEIISPCLDGYTIYIEERLDEASKKKALKHALTHISHDDWNRSNIQWIEYEAHRKEK